MSKHPKGLILLFFTEMWERFSYYGMRALLILFMVKVFLWSDEKAYYVFAAYGALVYATPFIGGYLADKILGYRKATYLGAILMAIGHFLMAGPDIFEGQTAQYFFYTALAFIIIGNGFFKPNISSTVGQLYEDGDSRRDSGFTIFYMGVNLGAFLAPLVCGFLGELVSWSLGFSLAGVGMLFGLFNFHRGRKILAGKGLPPSLELLHKKVMGISTEKWVYIGSFVVVPFIALLIYYYNAVTIGLSIFGVIVLAYVLYVAFSSTKVERERLFVVLILLVFTALFWSFFEQAATSINLFTERNTLRFGIPTSIFQSANPLFILLLAPLFSSIWLALARRKKDLSTPLKFALGIFLLGLGFGIFVLGSIFANTAGYVHLIWLLLGYMLITMGELCLSPVGLSMVTKLSPKKFIAIIMGAWFLSSAFAHNLGGIIASYTSTSQYNVPAIQYQPNINFVGEDVLKAKVFDIKYKSKTSEEYISQSEYNSLAIESEDIKNQYEPIKSYSEEIKVNIVVGEKVEAPAKPEAFNIYHHILPGEKLVLNARIPHLDPLGNLTNLSIIEETYTGEVKFINDIIFYQAADTVSTDTINLTLEGESGMDRLRYIISVNSIPNYSPRAIVKEFTQYVPTRKIWAKTDTKLMVLDMVEDRDGDQLGIEITQKPDLEKGYAKLSSNLHSYVTPSKTIHIYQNVFFYIMLFSFAAAFLLLLLVPILKKWMHGVN